MLPLAHLIETAALAPCDPARRAHLRRSRRLTSLSRSPCAARRQPHRMHSRMSSPPEEALWRPTRRRRTHDSRRPLRGLATAAWSVSIGHRRHAAPP
eukprot:5842832-Prymnesium_polylepis.1